jgi:hypothetical protein
MRPETRVLGDLRFRLLERWASFDPRAAFNYARNFSSNGESAPLTEPVLRRWAFSDPEGALQAWRELALSDRDRYTRDRSDFQGLHDIFRGLGKQSVSLAVAEIQSLTPGQQSVAWRAMAGLAANDEYRGPVLSEMSALPPDAIPREALLTALNAWKKAEPQSEAELDALRQWTDWAQFDRGEVAKMEELRAGMEFHAHDANRQAVADRLVGGAQTPAERSRRLERVVGMWASDDPVAAGQWLVDQGLDETAARAMRQYVRMIAGEHPAEALDWARGIPEAAARQRALDELEIRIRHLHPERADSLLRNDEG